MVGTKAKLTEIGHEEDLMCVESCSEGCDFSVELFRLEILLLQATRPGHKGVSQVY